MSGRAAVADLAALSARLVAQSWIKKIVLLDQVDSTNDEARRLAGGAAEGLVVVAEQQRSGRGRRGRSWYSPHGQGLYLSALFRPESSARDLTRWTLAGAVAACAACRSVTGVAIEIEWPNDLVHDDKKLGGVLTELRSQAGRATELVLGVGINVGQRAGEFPGTLSPIATSLGIVAGRPVDRLELAARYLEELGRLTAGLRRGDWQAIARRWEAWAPGGRGRRVRVTQSTRAGVAETFVGTTCGLDPQGALSVMRDNGDTETVRLIEAVEPVEC